MYQDVTGWQPQRDGRHRAVSGVAGAIHLVNRSLEEAGFEVLVATSGPAPLSLTTRTVPDIRHSTMLYAVDPYSAHRDNPSRRTAGRARHARTGHRA